MKVLRASVLYFCLAALLVGCGTQPKPPDTSKPKQPTTSSKPKPPATDVDRIQALWKVTKVVQTGKDAPIEGKEFAMVFYQGKFVMDFGSPTPVRGTYALGADAQPKTIELVRAEKRGDDTLWGIYKFQDDGLVLSMLPKNQGPRPTDFKSEPGSKAMLITLKREAADQATLAKKIANVVQNTRSNVHRLESMNHLRQILIALHMYSADEGHLPVQIADRNGKPVLSWRVAILPYIKGGEELFKQFKLEEPWDSEHNLKLLSQMPRVYRCPHRGDEKTATYFTGFKGPGGVLGGPKSVQLATISNLNGTAKTVMVAEGREAVPWTKPADIEFSLDKPVPPLGDPVSKKILAGFADGRSQTLPIDLDPKLIKCMVRFDNKELFQLP